MRPLKNSRTFQSDLHLPPLPYPDLKVTLSMYTDYLRAIVPNHIFLTYQDSIDKFAIEDTYLLEKNHRKVKENSKNWLEEWWMDRYYLTVETELIPFSMVSGFSSLHDKFWPPNNNSHFERASKYLNALLTCWCCLRHEVIAPERDENGDILSMFMYRSVFNAGRIPTKSRDSIYKYFKTLCEGECPTHIIISIQGFTFKVSFIQQEVVWPANKIEATLREIFDHVSKQDFNANVTPVTSLPKSHLASALEYSNRDHIFIEDIKQAILWLAFDESQPSLDNLLMSVMGCDSQDRCGIKSLSVTVFGNGLIGLNADSALVDPTILCNIIEFADIHVSKIKVPDYYPLKFQNYIETVIPNENWLMYNLNIPDSLQGEIFYIRKVYNMKAYQLDCGFRIFKWFNLKIATAWNVNPNVVVHLLILLTYYEIHKSFTTACAAVVQRRFYRGRYDIIPTMTVETINWIKAIYSKQCPNEKIKTYFLMAHKKLLQIFKYCENNCGPVTHLNFINSYFNGVSKDLNRLCNDEYYHKMGFSDKFAIKTFYLGEKHFVSITSPSIRLGYTFSYSVTEESTLLTAVHRCSEDQVNPRLPRIFLKEFVTSVEILNQLFTK